MKASAVLEHQNQGPPGLLQDRRAYWIDSLQTGGLLAFGLLLWMANLLPIQTWVLICESNAVISETRWSQLVQLGGSHELDSESIRWVSSSHISSSDSLRHLKLRMGLREKISTMELQQELSRLTTPVSTTSTEIPQPKLHKERWQVQVAQHAVSRFQLDCERRVVAVAEATVAPPFRFASRSSDSTNHEDRAMPEDRAMLDQLMQNLADAERALATAASKERTPIALGSGPGSLALTGSPMFYVQGSHSSALRIVSLTALVLGISWSGCRWATARSFTSKHSRFGKKERSNVVMLRAYRSLLYRLGIPYLGEIRLVAKSSALEQSQEWPEPTIQSRSKSRWLRIGRLSDGILMLWVTCFVLRYSIDPMWRDLLFRAPLAAFSSLVSGI